MKMLSSLAAMLLCATACGSEQTDDAVDAGPVDLIIQSREEAQALPAEVHGDLTFTGTALSGVLTIDGLRVVDGRLSFEHTEALESISLPSLERVAGSVSVEGNLALERLEAPQLEDVRALSVQSNARLRELFVAELASAVSVVVSGNPELSRLELPRLALMRRDDPSTALPPETVFSVRDNFALEALEAPLLAQVDDLRISGHGRLRALELPALAQVGELSVLSNYALEEVALPALEEARCESHNCELFAPLLRTLMLPSLQTLGGGLRILAASLSALELPELESLDSLALVSHALERFSAPRLVRVGSELVLNGRHLQSLALPALEEGCANFLLSFRAELPDCAAPLVAPRCSPDELLLRHGCTCDAQGDLSKADCPPESSP